MTSRYDQSRTDGSPNVMDAAGLLEEHTGTGYREFLDVPALSMGLFLASPGHVDEQEPHDRDEVYVVMAGEAVLDIAGVRHTVATGSVAYVPAGVRHHFAKVDTALRVLVFFAGQAA